jgi:FAD/FMN-containing dehydrogenase/ferredoxin
MSWKEYLMERARKTASRRRRIYGIEPAPRVRQLIMQESPPLSFREKRLLLSYILLKSPQRRIELFWKYITDKDTPVRRRQIESLAQDIGSHLSENCRVAINYFERRNYSRDLARVPGLMEKTLHRTTPSLVVQPNTEKDISAILKYCNLNKMAVFPRGSGSFAFGGAVPTRNGIVIDLSPMMAVLEVDPKAQTVRVQPGARWADVATHLAPFGLIPQTSPTSRFSTVAGWISTGGMGLDSYKYGNITKSVLAVRVVRPDGTIEELDSKDEAINDLFGTEGQFGILTEITLQVRPKPSHSGTRMLTFNNPGQAFAFIDELNNGDFQPSHVVYFDREYLKRENILFSDHSHSKEPIVPENDGILLHFETPEDEEKFLSSRNGNDHSDSEHEGKNELDNDIAPRYLWANRYFPLKAQRIGPGLLGTEVKIPRENIVRYMNKLKRLARSFNIKPAVEVIVCDSNLIETNGKETISKNGKSHSFLLIVSFRCDYSRTVHYVLSLLFNQLLVRMAVRFGGAPYGIGIWNTPFIQSKYSRDNLNKLKQTKNKIDPKGILNPNKFFKIRGRFFSIPSSMLHPVIFRPILALSHFFSPVIGLIARITAPEAQNRWDIPIIESDRPIKENNRGEDLLHQSAQRCTSCGACISVCPAYHITEDELVTGRSKLRMVEAMTNGMRLEISEAYAPFQCLHCGLCEEVCQTQLPLRDCYLVLEDWLENRFGSPADTVQDFVDQLDSRREFINDIFGLVLPDWSPEEKLLRVPAIERSLNGGEE